MNVEERRARRVFRLLAVAVLLLALVLREYFILVSHADQPLAGDIKQYVMYAYNLAHSGTFSMSAPGAATVVPDALRGPGYPLFLTLPYMLLPPSAQAAQFALALQLQALAGTATVLLCMLLARRWLSRGWTLFAGFMIAIWPHHVVATGALLSEVVFGLSLVLAAWLAIRAHERRRVAGEIGAGLSFAYAYLVNPIALLFPPLLALRVWRTHRRLALSLLLVPFLVAGAWGLRNHSLPPEASSGRAALNFVQGSWPLLHVAWINRLDDPRAMQLMKDIDAEGDRMGKDPVRGLREMSSRMAEAPAYYLRWYAIDKPFLLWDWDIRVGWGDIYFLGLDDSPYERPGLMNASKQVLRWLNPWIFLLAASAALAVAWRRRRGDEGIAQFTVALLCVYLTAIHVVFQAEPRYANAYRPLEMLMLATALSWLAAKVRATRQRQ
jgi:4-amino-4-deoxy-L-arabinose transferase-like glycosyltransferase